MPWFRPTTRDGRKHHPVHAPSEAAAAFGINRGINLPIPGTSPHVMCTALWSCAFLPMVYIQIIGRERAHDNQSFPNRFLAHTRQGRLDHR